MPHHYKTIVVSDVHLGTRGSKVKELIHFLRNHTCDRLILNGDIIDGWQLKKSGTWKKKHTRFFKLVLRLMQNEKMEVIYTRGNHDDFLDQVLPIQIGNFSIVRDYEFESSGKKYYVVHGDIFDSVTTQLKWIAKLGDIGYTLLLWVNHQYNKYRISRGLPYYSLSKEIKAKVKGAVSFISDFEKTLSELGKIRDCDGIICGHIHSPAIKQMGEILYLNSGDWVESLSALVEDNNGEWSIILYEDFIREYSRERLKKESFEENTLDGLEGLNPLVAGNWA